MTETVGAPAVAPPRRRDAALDGMRALAALAVLATHTADSSGAAGWQHDVLGLGAFRSGLALQQLNVGVEVFFVISAFLVYRPFVAAHLAGARAPSPWSFLTRRFWRIYPAYWVALFLIVGLSAAKVLQGFDTIVANTFLFQGWRVEWVGSNVGLRQSWSLVIEVAFYLLVPLWAWGVRALGRQVGALPAELVGIGAWMLIGPLSLWWLQHHSYSFVPWPLPFLGVFAWGMLFATLVAARVQLPRLVVSAPLCWTLAAAVFVLFVQRTSINPLATFALDASAQQLERLAHGVVAALCVAPLALADGRRSHRIVGWKPFALLGMWSYGFYLWHYYFLDTFRDHLFERGDLLFWKLFVTTALVTTVVAAASWYVIERPLIRRFRPRS